jgi:hypothetical protein
MKTHRRNPKRSRKSIGSSWITAIALAGALVFLAVAPSRAQEEAHGGKVLPAEANPYGYSLDDMANAMALFQTSAQLVSYPKTPFQILYCCSTAQFSSAACSDGKSGTLEVASNTFSVPAGTPFFVPLFLFDDTPPVLGVWPADKESARDYIFGPTQYGAVGTEIVVDGKVTAIGRDFLGGPVTPTAFGGATIDGIALAPSVGLLDALTSTPTTASITTVSRMKNVVTFNTTANTALSAGQNIVIANVSDPGYDGNFTIAAVNSPTQFTYAQNGPDSSASGGIATGASTCQQLASNGVVIPGCGNAGTHFLQLGPFLKPMSVGSDTVEIKGIVGNSSLFVQALGPFDGDCLQEDITYTVKVLPPLDDND